MNTQHLRHQSNTPIVLAIFGLLFAFPGIIFGGVKQAIQDTAIDVSQQALGMDLSFLSLGDIPFYMGIVATIGAFLCCILYKKRPRLLGGSAVILSLLAFYYLPSFFFLGLLSTIFYLIAGVIAFRQESINQILVPQTVITAPEVFTTVESLPEVVTPNNAIS